MARAFCRLQQRRGARAVKPARATPSSGQQDNQDRLCILSDASSGQEKHMHNSKTCPGCPDRPAFSDLTASLAYRGEMVRLPQRPPWHVISSRELARALGVHLQTLANWRIRGKGPKPEPNGRFRGNRSYYRLGDVIAWLTDEEPWHIDAAYLSERFVGLSHQTQETTADLVSKIEQHGIYSWHHTRTTRR